MTFDEDLDVPMPPRKPTPAPPTLAGFYRTVGLPAFWDGARAVREAEASAGGSVHNLQRVDVLRRAAEAGVPMETVPELREWMAHGR
jgi:hypothetical protein